MLSKTKALSLHQLSDENQVLVLLSWFHLSEEQKEQLKILSKKKIDWGLFMQLAIRTHLAALIYSNEKKLDFQVLSEEVRQKFKSYQLKILSFNTLLYHDFAQFQQKCNQQNLMSVPLKGIYFAEKIYEDISLRQLSDMDLLIAKNEVEKIKSILSELGWEIRETLYKSDFHKKYFEIASPFLAMNGRNTIDFHFELFSMGRGFALPFAKLINRLKSGTLNGIITQELDPIDHLVYMCLHLYKHVEADRIKLSGYADIAYFIEKMENELDSTKFVERCEEFDVLYQVSLILTTVRNLWIQKNHPFFKDFQPSETNVLFDHFLLKEFGEYQLSFSDKIQHHVKNRLIRNSFNWKKLQLIWFDVFPSDEFLKKTIGPYSYGRNWFYHKLNWFKRF